MAIDQQTIGADAYNKFYKSLQFVLKWEGGYVFDPTDPGGETKYGISKRAYPNLDIKNLTPEQALEIYYRDYWQKVHADVLDYPDCVALFDTGVNNGVSRALSWCSTPFSSQALLDSRMAFYIEIVKKAPEKQKFLGGWLSRIADLKKLIETS